MPTRKVRTRLDQLALEQEKLRAELDNIEDRLSAGAEVILEALDLLNHAENLYRNADDRQRLLLNRAFFKKLYVVGNRIVSAEFHEPFDDIVTARDSSARFQAFPAWPSQKSEVCENKRDRLANAFFGDGFSKSLMVDPKGTYLNQQDDGLSKSLMVGAAGLEPTTSAV
jgi:hypothetical protein